MSDALGIIGIIVSLVGIPLTWVFARRGRQRPDLRYVTDFDVLISPEDGLLARGLLMHFEDRQIARVSRTLVALWNKQGDTVHGVDVVPDDPLRVQLPEGDIALQARVVSISRPQIKFYCTLDASQPDRVVFDFDFLDAGDGVVVEILHQSAERPKIAGTARGVRLKDEGSAELTSAALDAVTASPIARLRPWQSNRSPILPHFAYFAYFTTLASCYVLGDTIFGWWRLRNRNGSLVRTGDYHLDTVEGQRAFAERVTHLQTLTWSPWSSMGSLSTMVISSAIAVALIYCTYRVWRAQIRAVIPRSIVSIRKPMNQVGSADELDSRAVPEERGDDSSVGTTERGAGIPIDR